MRLDANNCFFNFSNQPWIVERQPLFPDWNPCGFAFSSSIINVVTHGAIERPDWIGAQFCATVTGDKAEFVMYASDANEYGGGTYPWNMTSYTPLVQWIADPIVSGITHYWKNVSKDRVDALMAMKQPYGIRFGVACRFLSAQTQIEWHSARMLVRY